MLDPIAFRLEWPGDRVRWPWKFSFETRYSLKGSTVSAVCKAVNLNKRPMPAQLGFHPGFRCPFPPGGNRENDSPEPGFWLRGKPCGVTLSVSVHVF